MREEIYTRKHDDTNGCAVRIRSPGADGMRGDKGHRGNDAFSAVPSV